MFTKLLSIKTLKKIEFELNYLNDKEISQIKGENLSITEIRVFWKNENDDCILYDLNNKFPNLTKISVYIEHSYENYKKPKKLNVEIKQIQNCKINEIYFEGLGPLGTIKFYSQLFENLIGIEIVATNKDKNIKEVFPIFKENNNIVFKSLNYFKFDYDELPLDIINNIYLNLDKMPNLKTFKLNYVSKDIDKDFYKNFILKLLSKELDNIELEIKYLFDYDKELYSYYELKEIFPKLKCYDLKNIKIDKIK